MKALALIVALALGGCNYDDGFKGSDIDYGYGDFEWGEVYSYDGQRFLPGKEYKGTTLYTRD